MDALTVFFLYVEKVETSLLHYRFIKSYCLSRLLYGREGMLWNTLQTRKWDIIFAFRYILTVVGVNQWSLYSFIVAPNIVPLSYMTDERKLLFYRKLSLSKNVILSTLMYILRLHVSVQ